MQAYPITQNCVKNFETKQHVCFGVSPFNSFFSESRIAKLAEWGKSHFQSMHLFIPDIPSAYTLEALGYSEKDAEWKARRQCQYLKNKARRALLSVGYSDSEINFMILDWNFLSANETYLNSYQLVKQKFNNDDDFQTACLEASRWVLESRVEDTSTLTHDVLRSACRYLLTEIPLFINTSAIIGKKSSVFCYHQCVSIIENLFKGIFSISASENQGFVVLQDN